MEHQNNSTTTNDNPTVIIVKNEKSIGLAVLLTFLFGPLGMLYSTVSGAIIMFILSIIAGGLTLGVGLFFTWPICIIWGALAAAKTQNKKVEIKK